jgi:5-methylcytosine-specific restriction endonuclease McrA
MEKKLFRDVNTGVPQGGIHYQQCGALELTLHTSQIDHIRPVKRFRLPVNANTPGNLRTLCIPCHKEKTKTDRQVENLVP